MRMGGVGGSWDGREREKLANSMETRRLERYPASLGLRLWVVVRCGNVAYDSNLGCYIRWSTL